jgi:hypothetical protein
MRALSRAKGFRVRLCANAKSQDGGYTLGAQAGETAISRVVTAAGFSRFRRAAEITFNLVYEARPGPQLRSRDRQPDSHSGRAAVTPRVVRP